MWYLKKIVLLVVGGSFIISGCASTPQITAQTPVQDINAPCWVTKGGACFGGDRGRAIYGVASAYGIKNFSLLRSTADNRARTEISRSIKVYVSALCKDYMSSTTAGEANVSSEEQHVECAQKTVTAMNLAGSEILDHWQNSATGEFFSLARVDLNAFKDSAKKLKQLDSKLKEYIKDNADNLHKKLEKEEKINEGRQ